jgi:hypothetical protein
MMETANLLQTHFLHTVMMKVVHESVSALQEIASRLFECVCVRAPISHYSLRSRCFISFRCIRRLLFRLPRPVSPSVSICLSLCLYIYLSISLSLCLCLSLCLSVSLSACLSVSLSVCFSVCLSVCVCLSSICLYASLSSVRLVICVLSV